MMLRLFDIVFALLGLVLGLPVLLAVFLVSWLDTGSALLLQERVGRDQRRFILVKFRTMRVGTATTASHLVDADAITPSGRFLRRTKLDELPQLWNVLKGEMSLVGPRPCLPSQRELLQARARLGVFSMRPGITGVAQVRGIDMSTPELLAQTDATMLTDMTLARYLGLIVQSVLGSGRGDAARHP